MTPLSYSTFTNLPTSNIYLAAEVWDITDIADGLRVANIAGQVALAAGALEGVSGDLVGVFYMAGKTYALST